MGWSGHSLAHIVPALIAVLLAPAPAHGEDAAPPETPPAAGAGVSVPLDRLPEVMTPAEVVEVAKRLILAGQNDPARRLLERVLPQAPDPVDVRFLLGTIAVAEKRHGDAVKIYRDILTEKPGLTRVRLELARALFLNEEDEAAEHHFHLVLAAQPPGPVADNINKFLDGIRARKAFRYTFGVSVAPDTNINVAPEDERVDLFGLPFILDEDARKKSGVGMVVSGGAEYSPNLGTRAKLESNVFVRHSEYKGSMFDDTLVSAGIGPSFRWPRTTISMQATGYYRWYGHAAYNRSIGGQINWEQDIARRWRISATVGYQHVDYLLNDQLDGPLYSFVGAVTYGLSSRSYLRGVFAVNYERADSVSLRNTEWRYGLGYYREFGWGIIAYLQPEITFNPYKGIQPAFNRRRNDTEFRVGLSLIKRDINVWGFSPELRYTFVKNHSSIDFYDYDRHRVEIGVSRRF
ncbi:surface lipoprotein assembly modifier [Emcibacter sp. SYSU 3D8]|uniref:surface lipoprotein assembly modifier n=1 Tax=Emcibacter sp. SYSU 3D8 TaxID=3133969 RepID=UPI0031FE79B4